MSIRPGRRASRTAAVAALAMCAFALAAASAQAECGTRERQAALAAEQGRVLARLRPVQGVDLTRLRDAGDLAALAALGWDFYPHQFVSFERMGFGVVNPDFFLGNSASPGDPVLLLYEPDPASQSVTDPRGAPDFEYRLVGWGYLGTYDFQLPPAGLPCIERSDWFVHEQGVHPFATGGMEAVPPDERFRGETDSGEVPPSTPPDIAHERFWDIHFWLAEDGVPTVSILDPGRPIPGLDPKVGVNWFYPTWRNGLPPPRF